MEALYERDGERYVGAALSRGPWDARYQHGGPPSALLGRALERLPGPFALARITIELLRPVPVGVLSVDAAVTRDGRTVQRVEATLTADGETVARAFGVRIVQQALALPEVGAPLAVPPPEDLQPFRFTFFPWDIAYHLAVEFRYARGTWGDREVIVWGRPTVALVAGEGEMGPTERTLVLADAQSGFCPPMDPRAFSYVNPDLTVYFERPLVGGWAGFAARAAAHRHGIGLAESALFDAGGVYGRSAQSMVIVPRAA